MHRKETPHKPLSPARIEQIKQKVRKGKGKIGNPANRARILEHIGKTVATTPHNGLLFAFDLIRSIAASEGRILSPNYVKQQVEKAAVANGKKITVLTRGLDGLNLDDIQELLRREGITQTFKITKKRVY